MSWCLHGMYTATSQVSSCPHRYLWSEVVIFNLQVMFHNGMSNNDKDFEMCFKVDNVVLPKTGYFGISAATGGLAGKLPLTLNTLK
jgi:Legume-like lectin family